MGKSSRMLRMFRVGALLATIPFLAGGTKVSKFRSGVYDLKTHNFSLHWKSKKDKAYGSLVALKKHLDSKGLKAVLLTNAGIYGKNHAPLGLHVEDGKVLRPLNRSRGGGNFFLRPNGVFYIDKSGAHVVRTRRFPRNKKTLIAIQSGPLLFDSRGVHPKFRKSSKSKYIRNAIGVRRDGSVVIAISKVPVTFWELTSFMKYKMKCKAALYLDGSISQLWLEGDIVPYTFVPFVGILAVTKKAKS